MKLIGIDSVNDTDKMVAAETIMEIKNDVSCNVTLPNNNKTTSKSSLDKSLELNMTVNTKDGKCMIWYI